MKFLLFLLLSFLCVAARAELNQHYNVRSLNGGLETLFHVICTSTPECQIAKVVFSSDGKGFCDIASETVTNGWTPASKKFNYLSISSPEYEMTITKEKLVVSDKVLNSSFEAPAGPDVFQTFVESKCTTLRSLFSPTSRQK